MKKLAAMVCLAAALSASETAAFAGAVQSWRNDGGVLRIAAEGGEMSVAPLESGAFRFVAGKPCKFGFAVESDGPPAHADIGERADEIVVACGHATAAVEKSTGCFRLYDRSGRMLVREVPGARRFAPDGSARAEDRFAIGKNDAAYGLGQFRDGRLNLRGTRRDLLQENKKAAVPVVYSTGGWGILWNNPSRTAFSDDGNGMSFSSEWGEGIDAYLFAAPSLDGLVAQYRRLSGHVPMMPRWALGYHQSRNRYHDERQLFEVAARMKREGIPMDSIFIDYFWWGGNGTGSMRFDTKAWPDPKAMAERLRGEFGTHSVITVWPCFKPGTANYDAMKSEGLLVEGATALDGTVYDVCNPKARAKYRELLKPLVDTGMDGFFLDGPEPDHVTPWSKATTHLGPAKQVRNLYPLLHAMNFRAALDEYRPGRRHYMITRCAFAGQQRTGTAVWSGDIPATIDELRIQVAAGLSFTATGIPYWTTDIGGYHGGNPASEEYRETFARWFEYGAFCPVFRCHGRREPFDKIGLNELWEYGEKVKGICADYIRLRHRLMPYVYSLSARTTFDDYTPMRLLAFDFPGDEKTLDCRDEFMYGPAFLVCPVLELGATSRSVYLPKGCEWIDFWSGERHAGGKTVDAAAPLERIPLFVRAGSIVPTSDAVEIYGGADGSFELYSDDGESLGYLAGDYRRIPVAWDDAKKTVVVGRTKKATPTTLRFRLKGTDEERAVDYCGERVELKFPASPFSPQEGAVPGVRYEAERASLDGKAVLKGPTTDQKEIAAQASDNRYVELPAAGAKLTWTVGEDGADGVTLRFTMPDRADGWNQANPDDEVPQYRRGICRVNRWNDILRRKQKWLK